MGFALFHQIVDSILPQTNAPMPRMLADNAPLFRKQVIHPRNGTTFWTSCRNIYIRDLVTLDWAAKKWKNVSDKR